ncbi:unnamed protein product [Cylicocyclus nassatus]|uniref:Uncharacterized protein n=1 Tax=Cylicocyclus nassatus TaxID=53992 RepID=A0AA36H7Y6_CYLNA|nr:unnamed protein product [Cylicocyclus nassatus]
MKAWLFILCMMSFAIHASMTAPPGDWSSSEMRYDDRETVRQKRHHGFGHGYGHHYDHGYGYGYGGFPWFNHFFHW